MTFAKTFGAVFSAVIAAAGLFLLGVWSFHSLGEWESRKTKLLESLQENEKRRGDLEQIGKELDTEQDELSHPGVPDSEAALETLRERYRKWAELGAKRLLQSDREPALRQQIEQTRRDLLLSLKQILETKPLLLPLNSEERSLLEVTNKAVSEFTPSTNAQPSKDDFIDERQTLYAQIISPISATTPNGSIDLKPNDLVLVTAHNSKFVHIEVNGKTATIPISATDLPSWFSMKGEK